MKIILIITPTSKCTDAVIQSPAHAIFNKPSRRGNIKLPSFLLIWLRSIFSDTINLKTPEPPRSVAEPAANNFLIASPCSSGAVRRFCDEPSTAAISPPEVGMDLLRSAEWEHARHVTQTHADFYDGTLSTDIPNQQSYIQGWDTFKTRQWM